MEKVKFRPHHIFCMRFLQAEFPERGEEFEHADQRTKDIIQACDDTPVEVTEGIDELCRVCPDCREDRCENPQGDEEAVRKWDNIILKGLGVSYGETKTSEEWCMLIKKKAPLDFCQTRCPWKSSCAVSHMD